MAIGVGVDFKLTNIMIIFYLILRVMLKEPAPVSGSSMQWKVAPWLQCREDRALQNDTLIGYVEPNRPGNRALLEIMMG